MHAVTVDFQLIRGGGGGRQLSRASELCAGHVREGQEDTVRVLTGHVGCWSLMIDVFDFFLIIYVCFFYKIEFVSFMSHWALRGRDTRVPH